MGTERSMAWHDEDEDTDNQQPCAQLTNLENAKSKSEAYEIAESLIRQLDEDPPAVSPIAVAAYLRNEGSKYRQVFLACAADHDLALDDLQLRSAILPLLRHTERSLVQTAALALHAGGPESRDALHLYLHTKHAANERLIQDLLTLVSSR